MGRTFIRQDVQIRKSDLYVDNTAPTETNYETSPVNIEDDLNSLRSAVQNILNRNGAAMPSGNWFDNIVEPSTFESGARRGVSEINQQLHDLERKRILAQITELATITVPAAVASTGTLTLTGNVVASDQVKLGARTYTFTSPLGASPGDVLLGATTADSIDNLVSAINNAPAGAGVGVLWAAGTLANGSASAVRSASTLVATALLSGTAGNTVDSTDPTDFGGVMSWTGTKLAGGTGDVNVLTLAPDELPTWTLGKIAAIGSVTTRGTVCANNATFGVHGLDLVSGANAINPKNLCILEDASTHDPIISGDRIVHALFQSESNTDGTTLTGTTPNRAQLSYVRINSGGTALEAVPSADIAGKTLHYASVGRKALEDLNEQDFLRGAVIDVGAGSADRQNVYDNQGTTPVELLNNATLDIAGGFYWEIRDVADASLFRVTEGSGTSASTIEFAAGTDVFDNNAVSNDFAAGATIRSGGSNPIAVGVTDGTIATTANALTLAGATDLVFSDQNYAGSTYDTPFNLSDTSAEWSLFETNFGEVSLLNALNQAYSKGARKPKVYANVTATINAGDNAGGVSGGTNLDAQLPAMDGGTFLTDYDIFVNGELMRPAAGVGVNDYYPGTSLPNGQLKFDYKLKIGDVICCIPYNA